MANKTKKINHSRDELDLEVDQMLELATSGKFESGIYNFCDRWCEKCADTDKCYLFAEDEFQNGKKLLSGQVNEDEGNWFKDIEHSFAVTERLIERKFAEQGIDIAEVLSEAKNIKSWDDHAEKRYKNAPGYKSARQYMKEIHDFLNKFHENRLEYLPTLGMEVDYSDIKDEIEVISWYCTMLPTKIWRYYYDEEAVAMEKNCEFKELMAADLPKTYSLVEKCLKQSLHAWENLIVKRNDLALNSQYFIQLLEQIKIEFRKSF